MQDATRQKWFHVCAEAAICDDPERFEELIEEINTLLKTQRDQFCRQYERGLGLSPTMSGNESHSYRMHCIEHHPASMRL